MQMTSTKLIAIRLFMLTVGRSAWCARTFKRFMVWWVVQRQGQKKKTKYLPSSRFFTLDQLDRS